MEGNFIRPPDGAKKKKRIAGRGASGYRGSKAGKGDKGQNARSGGGVRPGFEGGQMPLYRRIPRRGFNNFVFQKAYEIVNISDLNKKFTDGDTVNLDTLREKRIVKKKRARVKVLGQGEINIKLIIAVDAISAQAREKIVQAGGTVTDRKGEVDGE